MDAFSISGSSIVKLPPINTPTSRQQSSAVQSRHAVNRTYSQAMDALPNTDIHGVTRLDSKSSRSSTSSKSSKSSGPATSSIASNMEDMKPTRVYRPKHWDANVENAFRYQLAGYRDVAEYLKVHDIPDNWDDENGFIKCLQNKKTGFFMYFRKSRECEDKHVNRVMIYEY